MSYILDALKKSQNEQANAGAQLQMQPAPKRSVSQWLLVGLAVLLGINASVMLAYFIFDDEPTETQVTTTSPVRSQSRPVQRPIPQAQPQVTQTQPPPLPRRQAQPLSEQQPLASTRQLTPPTTQPTKSAPLPKRTPKPIELPKRTPTPIAAPTVPRMDLQELPEAEQALYNGFKYSSHIFSPDDPTAGAIFIDGKMLKIGDKLNDLVVSDITEFAVVFRETQDGESREVEVVLADQWN